MKNTVKTEIVTIRLPNELVAYIEKHIDVTEEYANRPDFVITAIRKYIDDFNGFFYIKGRETRNAIKMLDERSGFPTIDDEKMCEKMMEKNANVLHEIDTWEGIYSTFGGEPTRIVIRIPIGFRKRWEEIKDFDARIGNYQDFIRLSIIALIKHPEHEMRVVLSALSGS